MKVKITKSARRFGYLIWNGKLDDDIKSLVCDADEIEVVINHISLGIKHIDWKHHRIYLGTVITRGIDDDQIYYELHSSARRLEITTIGGC